MVACLFVPSSSAAGMGAGAHGRLLDAARQCSPRVEARAANLMVLDLEGMERAFGNLEALGTRVWQAANDAGCVPIQIAVAGTRTAAILLAVARAGLTIVPAESTETVLAALPLSTLGVFATENRDQGPGTRDRIGSERPRSGRARTSVPGRTPVPDPRSPIPDLLSVFARWGLRTLGQLAALPAADLSARVGQSGLLWQRLARGEDACPLVPVVDEDPFEATQELEWPIDTLEPLSFVMGGLLEPLCRRLERRDRAVAVLSLQLRLVTRERYTRTLQLPAPMREPKVLRTLLLLDLESHPAPAGIDAVTIAVEPTPGRIIQESLFVRAVPAPEQVSTLLARLGALLGESRCGSPRLVDSHRPGAFAMAPFRVPEAPRSLSPNAERQAPVVALRRFRLPVPARVLVDEGHPVSVRTDRQGLEGGRVLDWGGPWRTSGEWWEAASAARASELDRLCGRAGWDRDEWEVALGDGGVYRVFEDRESGRWFVEGIVD